MLSNKCWIAVAVLLGTVWGLGCIPFPASWLDDAQTQDEGPTADSAPGPAVAMREDPPASAVPQPARAAPQVPPAQHEYPATSWSEPATPAAGFEADAVAMAALPAEPGTQAVDLLALVDLQRDSLRGTWVREGSSIVSPAEQCSVLIVPRTVTNDYRWSVDIQRLSGGESLNLCLSVGGRQTMVVLEGFGTYSRGLNLVDGRTANQNITTSQGRVFQSGVPCTIVCTVRQVGPVEYNVQVVCDGSTIIDWTGPPARLALDTRFWSGIPPGRLAVAIYDGPNARFRISAMQLESIESSWGDGSSFVAQSPRPSPPAPPAPSRPSSSRMAEQMEAARERMEAARREREAGRAGPSFGRRHDPGPVTEPPEAALQRKDSVALIDHPLGAGTGFMVRENLLATNAHVVSGSYVDDLDVHFATDDDRRYRAKRVVYANELCDIALVEVIGVEQAVIPLADDLTFQRGQGVVIIGNPSVTDGGIMMRNAVTQGTVTALMRIKGYDFYQIDAAVNPGSSGGPILNLDGEVVAVVAMKATDQGEADIRSALRQLDDSFRARFDRTGRSGIAFGVPARALSQAIQQAETQSEDQADRIHDRHVAKSLFQRMSTLGAIHLLEYQTNVTPEIRQQAFQLRVASAKRRVSGPQPRNVDLMPEQVAGRLRQALNSQEIRNMVRVSSAELDERLDQLRRNGRTDEKVFGNLENLLRVVRTAKRSADSTPSYYQAYSRTFFSLNDDLKRLIEELNVQLAVGHSVLDD